MLPCPTIVWRRTGQARRSCPVSRRPVKLTGKSAADGVSYCPLCLNGLCVDRWPPTVESVASGDVERTWRRDGLDWYARPSRCSSRVEKLAKTASRPCNGHVPHLLQCTPPFSGVPVFGRLYRRVKNKNTEKKWGRGGGKWARSALTRRPGLRPSNTGLSRSHAYLFTWEP